MGNSISIDGSTLDVFEFSTLFDNKIEPITENPVIHTNTEKTLRSNIQNLRGNIKDKKSSTELLKQLVKAVSELYLRNFHF